MRVASFKAAMHAVMSALVLLHLSDVFEGGPAVLRYGGPRERGITMNSTLSDVLPLTNESTETFTISCGAYNETCTSPEGEKNLDLWMFRGTLG